MNGFVVRACRYRVRGPNLRQLEEQRAWYVSQRMERREAVYRDRHEERRNVYRVDCQRRRRSLRDKQEHCRQEQSRAYRDVQSWLASTEIQMGTLREIRSCMPHGRRTHNSQQGREGGLESEQHGFNSRLRHHAGQRSGLYCFASALPVSEDQICRTSSEDTRRSAVERICSPAARELRELISWPRSCAAMSFSEEPYNTHSTEYYVR